MPPNVVPVKIMGKPITMLAVVSKTTVLSTLLVLVAVVV
jgi:hypothetical protein